MTVLHGSKARPPTVLVVDDEITIRRAVQRILARQGFGVVEASSGDEALAVIEGGRVAIDVVLSDVVMPGLRGTELVRRLQGKEGGPRCMLMTGVALDDLQDELDACGSVPMLPKPWFPGELTAAVRGLLEGETG